MILVITLLHSTYWLLVIYLLSCAAWLNWLVLYITQRFEKLCRAILASMEVENEPKVSVHMFIPWKYLTFLYEVIYFISNWSHVWLSGLVCFVSSLQRSHHPLAQTDKRCAVALLSATEVFKGQLYFEVEEKCYLDITFMTWIEHITVCFVICSPTYFRTIRW